MNVLITKKKERILIYNGLITKTLEKYIDHKPVVKLFIPHGRMAWFLSEQSLEDRDLYFGFWCYRNNPPVFGDIRLSDITRRWFSIKRDDSFIPSSCGSAEFAATIFNSG